MASEVNPIASLQGRVTASGALVVTIGSATQPPPGTIGEGRNPLLSLQGRVTADNELVIRTA